MRISVPIDGDQVTMHVDDKILTRMTALGIGTNEVTAKLQRAIADKFGDSVGIATGPGAFIDLITQAIKTRGERHFRPVKALKEPVFAIVDHSESLFGFVGGVFFCNEWVFDVLLPVMPSEYRPVVLQIAFSHAMLLGAGQADRDVQAGDSVLADKLLGPLAGADLFDRWKKAM